MTMFLVSAFGCLLDKFPVLNFIHIMVNFGRKTWFMIVHIFL